MFFETPKNRKLRILVYIFIFLVYLYFDLRLATLINTFSVDIVYYDQWDIFTPIFENAGVWEIFSRQAGPLRLGLALLIDSQLLKFTVWNVRAIAFAAGFYIMLAAIFALLLKIKIFKNLSLSDAIIPLTVLTLKQFENVTIDPFPAYGPFPLMLIFLYALAWLVKKDKLRYFLVLLLNFLLIYSQPGILMGFITIAAFLIEALQARISKRSFVLPALACGVAVASLASFFIDFWFNPAVSCFNLFHKPWWEYLIYISLMFANFIGYGGFTASQENIVAGTFVFSIVFFVGSLSFEKVLKGGILRQRSYFVIFLLTSFSLLFAISASYGRVCLGVEQSQAPKYTTFMIPAFIGLYFFILTMTRKNVRHLSYFILFTFLVLSEYPVIQIHYSTLADYFYAKTEWRRCYLEHEDIEYCDEVTNFQISPLAEDTNLKEKLEFLKSRRLNIFSDRKKGVALGSQVYYSLLHPREVMVSPVPVSLDSEFFKENIVFDGFEEAIIDESKWFREIRGEGSQVRQEGGKMFVELFPDEDRKISLNSQRLLAGDFLMTMDFWVLEVPGDFSSLIVFTDGSEKSINALFLDFRRGPERGVVLRAVSKIEGREKLVGYKRFDTSGPFKVSIMRLADSAYFIVDDQLVGLGFNVYRGAGRISFVLGPSDYPAKIAIDNFELKKR